MMMMMMMMMMETCEAVGCVDMIRNALFLLLKM